MDFDQYALVAQIGSALMIVLAVERNSLARMAVKDGYGATFQLVAFVALVIASFGGLAGALGYHADGGTNATIVVSLGIGMLLVAASMGALISASLRGDAEE